MIHVSEERGLLLEVEQGQLTNTVILDSVAEVRARAIGAEESIRQLTPVELTYRHFFSKGVYAREMFIPKGTVLTGKIHKFTNLNIMSQGDLSVLTENGVVRVRAPFTVVSPPGTKRIAYAHEDTIWTTIHGTDENDVDKIEAIFIAQDEAEFLAFCEQQRQIESGGT